MLSTIERPEVTPEAKAITDQIAARKILRDLAKKGLGLFNEGRFIRVCPDYKANVNTEANLITLRALGVYEFGMERELAERFNALRAWFEEVTGTKITGQSGTIPAYIIANDMRLYFWLEPTHEDRAYYKYAVMNAKKWHKTISKAEDTKTRQRFAWAREMWEILKFDCTPAELESIREDAHNALASLNGAWSALRYEPRSDWKSAQYDKLKRQYAMCYKTMTMIDEELHERDKIRQQDANEQLLYWHPLDEDPIQHERDACRIRLHHWATYQEKHHA